jgi:hypothetical protein
VEEAERYIQADVQRIEDARPFFRLSRKEDFTVLDEDVAQLVVEELVQDLCAF